MLCNSDCFAPVITLSPSASTLASPLEFQRNQNIYIMARIQMNCNISFSTSIVWKVKECSSNCSSEVQLDAAIITTLSELYIPAETLPYGHYELTLTVTMIASSTLISSISTYIRVNPSLITPNLIQYGTSMITHGHHQNLTMNPGEYSINPDSNEFDMIVSY